MNDRGGGEVWVRFRIVLVEKAASVAFVEDAGEAPWVIVEGLDVLDLHEENVTGLGGLDLERTGEVVDLCQVDVLDVVGAVVVLDLPSSPVETFDLDCLAILDCTTEGYIGMPTVVEVGLVFGGLVEVDCEGGADFARHVGQCRGAIALCGSSEHSLGRSGSFIVLMLPSKRSQVHVVILLQTLSIVLRGCRDCTPHGVHGR